MDIEDPLTKLNTQLNRSMVLMEPVDENVSQSKSKKSIKIDTSINTKRTLNSSVPGSKRKSILKKSVITENDGDECNNTQNHTANDSQVLLAPAEFPRPHNLSELIQIEALTKNTTASTFNLDELSDSEDIWIMDIPQTVDPKQLKGQTLILGNKSKLKIGEEKYCAYNHETKSHLTCVFNTGKVRKYKTLNIKPTGALTIRRKLHNAPKIELMSTEDSKPPFPDNLKLRHPLFGVTSEIRVKKEKDILNLHNEKRKIS